MFTNAAQILLNQVTDICHHVKFQILNIFSNLLLLQGDKKAEDSEYVLANLRACGILK